jgi:hypothetical protein
MGALVPMEKQMRIPSELLSQNGSILIRSIKCRD